jgi:hypothetical protein
MAPRKSFITALCLMMILVAVPISASTQTVNTVVKAPAAQAVASLDKRALDTLKLMSYTITQAKTVKFQARSMVPVKTPSGMWINLYGTSRVVIQGQDKLFASTGGDHAAHDFYFDGKTITRYSPDKNLYAVKEAPGTIDELIEKAREEGKTFPYADLLIGDPYAVLTEGLTNALYVGQSTTRPLSGSAGEKVDHLAFAHPGVQWQIWIGVENHLPLLVIATYLDDASEPSYAVEFGDWKLNEPVDPTVFAFNNVSKASKIEYRDPAVKK